jgi:hypothetical protein
LTARFIFKKSDATATINSAFDTHFNPSAGGGGFTQEEIEDFIGAMVSGNTETGIDVTYDDAGAKLNFVAEVTQAELDAHTGDTTDAHDGTAISFVDSGGNYLSTDVQAALLEIEFIAKKDFRAYLVRINTQTISATKTLTDSDKVMQFLTASGGDQKVLLPAPAVTNAGTFIANVGGSNSIIVRNSGDTTTYITLTPGTSALLLSNATSWYVLQPITDANLPTSDITTNDLSTTKHGFAPKAPNDTNKYLRGDATWGVPAGGSGADKYPFEARLTLETGVPYSLTPQTAKTTIYLTPYHGNQIAVYDGAAWDVLTLSGDISASLAGLTANLPYDVFVYDSSGTLTLELVAWTNGTTRATAIVTQDGIDVKSGATTRRLAGTILITGTTGQCEMSATFCGISNRYNLLPHGLFSCPGYSDGSSNSTYTTTSTTFVEANGGTGSRIKFVLCKERLTEIHMKFTGLHGSGGQAIAAAGIDTITNPNTSVASAPGIFIPMYDVNNFNGVPLAVGSHYAALLFCAAAAGTITAYADIGTTRSGASQDSRTTWIQAAIWM